MRVVAGKARGHKLSAPVGTEIRPTSDRAKEALFNMISERTQGADFLDLFSGSGAIGIEALSRGANFCAMIEGSTDHCRVIQRNLDHVKKALGSEDYLVINAILPEGLKRLRGRKFDIVFMDPPYGKDLLQPVLEKISGMKLLKDGGTVIVEQSAEEEPPQNTDFEVIKHKKYGAAAIYILVCKEQL